MVNTEINSLKHFLQTPTKPELNFNEVYLTLAAKEFLQNISIRMSSINYNFSLHGVNMLILNYLCQIFYHNLEIHVERL